MSEAKPDITDDEVKAFGIAFALGTPADHNALLVCLDVKQQAGEPLSRCGGIFVDAYRAILRRGETPDVLSVSDELKARGQYSEFGGAETFSRIVSEYNEAHPKRVDPIGVVCLRRGQERTYPANDYTVVAGVTEAIEVDRSETVEALVRRLLTKKDRYGDHIVADDVFDVIELRFARRQDRE